MSWAFPAREEVRPTAEGEGVGRTQVPGQASEALLTHNRGGRGYQGHATRSLQSAFYGGRDSVALSCSSVVLRSLSREVQKTAYDEPLLNFYPKGQEGSSDE